MVEAPLGLRAVLNKGSIGAKPSPMSHACMYLATSLVLGGYLPDLAHRYGCRLATAVPSSVPSYTRSRAQMALSLFVVCCLVCMCLTLILSLYLSRLPVTRLGRPPAAAPLVRVWDGFYQGPMMAIL